MMVIARKWRMQSAADKLVTQTWVVFLLLVLVTGTLVTVLITNQIHNDREDQSKAQQNSDLQCIATWANATNHRSATLAGLSNLRSTALRHSVDAEHTLVSYALTHPNASPAEAKIFVGLLVEWNRELAAYQTADSNYTGAIAANPVPPAVFTCSDRLGHMKVKTAVSPSPAHS